MGGSGKRDLQEIQRAALARVDWRELCPRLENFARAIGATSSDAEDAVQTAVKQLFAGATHWHPVTHPDVGRHLMRAVRRTLSRARRSAEIRREVLLDSFEDEPAPASERAARERAARAAEVMVRLREAMAGDGLALTLLDLAAEGVDRPAAQAARLGLPKGEVYDARDRITRQLRRVAAEQQAAVDEEEVAQ